MFWLWTSPTLTLWSTWGRTWAGSGWAACPDTWSLVARSYSSGSDSERWCRGRSPQPPASCRQTWQVARGQRCACWRPPGWSFWKPERSCEKHRVDRTWLRWIIKSSEEVEVFWTGLWDYMMVIEILTNRTNRSNMFWFKTNFPTLASDFENPVVVVVPLLWTQSLTMFTQCCKNTQTRLFVNVFGASGKDKQRKGWKSNSK